MARKFCLHYPRSILARFTWRLLLIFALINGAPLLAEDKAAVETWKKATHQAKKALEKGQFDHASDLYEKALAQAEKFGPDDFRLSDTLIQLACVYIELREYPDAEIAMRRALAIDEKRLGTNDFHLATEYLSMGEICAFCERYEEADRYDLRAQTLMEWKFGKFDRMVGLCILQRADVAMMDNRLEESEKLFKEALELIESERSKIALEPNRYVTRLVMLPNRLQVARLLNDMGLLYKKEKKFGDAETAFNHSLKLIEYEYGKYSLNLCSGLFNLADVYAQEGKLADAGVLLRRSLAILKAVDPDNPMTIQTRKFLDTIAQAINRAEPSSSSQK